MRKLNHFGIPTQTVQAGENYAEGLKVHLTDFSKSENKIEFLRFEEGMGVLIVDWPKLPECLGGTQNAGDIL